MVSPAKQDQKEMGELQKRDTVALEMMFVLEHPPKLEIEMHPL